MTTVLLSQTSRSTRRFLTICVTFRIEWAVSVQGRDPPLCYHCIRQRVKYVERTAKEPCYHGFSCCLSVNTPPLPMLISTMIVLYTLHIYISELLDSRREPISRHQASLVTESLDRHPRYPSNDPIARNKVPRLCFCSYHVVCTMSGLCERGFLECGPGRRQAHAHPPLYYI